MSPLTAVETFGLPLAILGDADAAIIAIDHAERVTFLNAIAEERYGVSASQAIGRPLHALYRYQWIEPEDAEKAFAALADAGIWQGRNIHILRDGSAVTVDSVVRVVNRPDSAPGMVAVIREVDRRRVA